MRRTILVLAFILFVAILGMIGSSDMQAEVESEKQTREIMESMRQRAETEAIEAAAYQYLIIDQGDRHED